MGALRFHHFGDRQRTARHEALFQAQVFDDELLAVGRVLAHIVSEHLLDAAVVRVLSNGVASRPKGAGAGLDTPTKKAPRPRLRNAGLLPLGELATTTFLAGAKISNAHE